MRLKWAGDVTLAFKNGLETTIRELREHWKEIRALPDYGIPGKLKAEVEELLAQIGERLGQDSFYQHGAELNITLTAIKTSVHNAVEGMAINQKVILIEARQELALLKEWNELGQEERGRMLAQLDELEADPPLNLNGLKQSVNSSYAIQAQSAALKRDITTLGRQRMEARWRDEEERARREGRGRIPRTLLTFPIRVTNSSELEELITQLQALKAELAMYTNIEVIIRLKD